MGEHKQPGTRKRTEPSLGDIGQLDGDVHARKPAATPTPARAGKGGADDRPVPPAPTTGWASAWRRRSVRWGLLAVLVLGIAVLAWSQQDALRALFPRTQLNTLLVRADKALAAGHLDGNDGTSARELYSAVRALEPDNEQAIDGLRKVGQAELARARKAIAARNYELAQNALANARSLLGGGDAVHAVAAILLKARQSQAQTDILITRAQQALAAGKLDGDQGAAALYRQALAADPDNAVARHGMDKVGDALAVQARTALDQGQLDQAGDLIGRIALLMPGYADLPSLRASLSQARQQAQAAIDAHLKQADDALRAGHVSGTGEDNALAQYQAVLKIDPNNAQARTGIGQVAQALLLRARASIDAQDFGDASKLLKQATALAPHSADLAAVRAHLQRAQADAAQVNASRLDPAQQARLDKLLARARAAVQAGDFLLPPGASAYDLYSEALNIDGNNPDALQGLQGLAGQARTRFDQALSSGNLQQAGKMLSVLQQLVPGDPSHESMRRRLAGAWLDRAEQKLDAGNRDAALQALNAAGKLRPDAPRLQSLRTRIGRSS